MISLTALATASRASAEGLTCPFPFLLARNILNS